jgi:hypothetical protein
MVKNCTVAFRLQGLGGRTTQQPKGYGTFQTYFKPNYHENRTNQRVIRKI